MLNKFCPTTKTNACEKTIVTIKHSKESFVWTFWPEPQPFMHHHWNMPNNHQVLSRIHCNKCLVVVKWYQYFESNMRRVCSSLAHPPTLQLKTQPWLKLGVILTIVKNIYIWHLSTHALLRMIVKNYFGTNKIYLETKLKIWGLTSKITPWAIRFLTKLEITIEFHFIMNGN